MLFPARLWSIASGIALLFATAQMDANAAQVSVSRPRGIPKSELGLRVLATELAKPSRFILINNP